MSFENPIFFQKDSIFLPLGLDGHGQAASSYSPVAIQDPQKHLFPGPSSVTLVPKTLQLVRKGNMKFQFPDSLFHILVFTYER